MHDKLLLNPSFYTILFAIDADLAKQAFLKDCQYCGGALHKSDYPRSPLV